MNMMCDLCSERIATVHLTEIVNEQIIELHLCQECAKIKAEELKQQLSIPELLSGITSEPSMKHTERVLICNFCGMTFEGFKKGGRLGCAQCYQAFKKKLHPLIKKVHGALYHKGKVALKLSKDMVVQRELQQLQERLDRAVKLEEYEEAARLRDKIKILLNQHKNGHV